MLRNRKQRIERRLTPKNWEDQPRPMFKASNIHYEMAERTAAMNCGGIGAMHLMVQRLGLVEDIDRSLELLKVHLPYHESDHVLNLAYNILAGGQSIEDIELRRQDEVFMNGLRRDLVKCFGPFYRVTGGLATVASVTSGDGGRSVTGGREQVARPRTW